MIINLFQTEEYKALITEHISKTISFFFEKQQEFSVACQVKHIVFLPELPQDIQKSFDEVVLFIVSGYSYESAHLDDVAFSFEAGFGSDNFGSTVTIPLLAIKQIFVGENPIVFNLAEHTDIKVLDNDTQESSSKTSMETSMKSLLNNPENKKLLKRKK
jgi:stringent starvation protein B